MLRAVLRPLSALALISLATACNGRASREECDAMLGKYLDMTIAADPALANLPPAEAHAAREIKKALRMGEPSYARVEQQCEAEVSRKEYRCAMKAPNPDTWEACID